MCDRLIDRLPTELVREISEYMDTVYWCKRVNKYVTKISAKDERYDMVYNVLSLAERDTESIEQYMLTHVTTIPLEMPEGYCGEKKIIKTVYIEDPHVVYEYFIRDGPDCVDVYSYTLGDTEVYAPIKCDIQNITRKVRYHVYEDIKEPLDYETVSEYSDEV